MTNEYEFSINQVESLITPVIPYQRGEVYGQCRRRNFIHRPAAIAISLGGAATAKELELELAKPATYH